MNSIETVFEWLLAATLRASVLVVVILCIQLALRRWLPASWRHALWLPMLAVLVLPVLPEAPFALFPQTAAAKPAAVVAERMPVEKVAPVVITALNESAVAALPMATAPVINSAPASAPKSNILAILWLAGAGAVLAAGWIGYRRNLRRIQLNATSPDQLLQITLAETALEAGLKRAPRTVISPAVASPAVTGFVRPVLLLPAGFPEGFSPAEARLILLHEFTHLKRLDLPLNWLMCALQAMHWFNPLLWFAFARMRADRELACDARVLSIDASDRRAEYGGALLKLQCVAPTRALSLGFVGIFERGSEIKSRIREISTHRRARLARQIAGGVIVTLLMVFGVTKAQHDARPEPEKDSDHDVAVNAPSDPKLLAVLDSLKKNDAAALSALLPGLSVEQATAMVQRLAARWGDLSKLEITHEKLPAQFHKGNMKVVEHWGRQATHTGNWLELRSDAAPDRWMRAGLQYAKDDPQPRQFLAVEWGGEANKEEDPATAVIRNKLNTIIIPSIDFEDTSVEEAIDFLRFRAAQLDAAEKDPDRRGINFVIRNPRNAAAAAAPAPMIRELRLRNVPLGAALKEICEQANLSYTVDENAIVISPRNEAGAEPAMPAMPADADAAKTAVILNKLKSIIIPGIDFQETSLDEAVDFLRLRAAELDAEENNPAMKGINIVIRKPHPAGDEALAEVKIDELRLRNVPLGMALRMICEQAGFQYTVDDFAVILSPQDENGTDPAIAADPADIGQDSNAARIATLSQITSQVGKYPHPSSEFFKSACVLSELKRILGPDYKAYREHLSQSGAGMLGKEGEYVCGDVSQLHVGGYSSLFYVDTKNEKMYLFWLKKPVMDKEYQIYGDSPIPAAVLSSIAKHMNETWGHVATFRFAGERLIIENKK